VAMLLAKGSLDRFCVFYLCLSVFICGYWVLALIAARVVTCYR
jgi:hypothetical protein